MLTAELPSASLDRDALGIAIARLLAVCDLLLDRSVRWLWPGAKAPPELAREPTGRRGARALSPHELGELPTGRDRRRGLSRACRCTRSPRGRPLATLAALMQRVVMQRRRPSRGVLTGDSADVYFRRAEEILAREGLDPVVVMEVFARQAGILCGIDEAKVLLAHALADAPADEAIVESLADGDPFAPKEIVLRIRAPLPRLRAVRDRHPGHAGAVDRLGHRRAECVDAAAPEPVISFGARHVHPHITDALDYAAIVGGCVGASTPAGARLAGLAPDRHDAPLARARLRRHGPCRRGLRPARGPRRPAHRARRHLPRRGRGGAARRARPGRPALRRPPRHARPSAAA